MSFSIRRAETNSELGNFARTQGAAPHGYGARGPRRRRPLPQIETVIRPALNEGKTVVAIATLPPPSLFSVSTTFPSISSEHERPSARTRPERAPDGLIPKSIEGRLCRARQGFPFRTNAGNLSQGDRLFWPRRSTDSVPPATRRWRSRHGHTSRRRCRAALWLSRPVAGGDSSRSEANARH